MADQDDYDDEAFDNEDAYAEDRFENEERPTAQTAVLAQANVADAYDEKFDDEEKYDDDNGSPAAGNGQTAIPAVCERSTSAVQRQVVRRTRAEAHDAQIAALRADKVRHAQSYATPPSTSASVQCDAIFTSSAGVQVPEDLGRPSVGGAAGQANTAGGEADGKGTASQGALLSAGILAAATQDNRVADFMRRVGPAVDLACRENACERAPGPVRTWAAAKRLESTTTVLALNIAQADAEPAAQVSALLLQGRVPCATTQLCLPSGCTYFAVAYRPLDVAAHEALPAANGYTLEPRVRAACIIAIVELRRARGSAGPVHVVHHLALCSEEDVTCLAMAAGDHNAQMAGAGVVGADTPAVLFAAGHSGGVYAWHLQEPSWLHGGLAATHADGSQLTWAPGLRHPTAYTVPALLHQEGTRMAGDQGRSSVGRLQLEDGPAVALQLLVDPTAGSSAGEGGQSSGQASSTVRWRVGMGLGMFVAKGRGTTSADDSPAGAGSAGGSGWPIAPTVQIQATHASGRCDVWTLLPHNPTATAAAGSGDAAAVTTTASGAAGPSPSSSGPSQLEALTVGRGPGSSAGRAPTGTARFVLTSSTPAPEPKLHKTLAEDMAPVGGPAITAQPSKDPRGSGAGGLASAGGVAVGSAARAAAKLEAEQLKRQALQRYEVASAEACPPEWDQTLLGCVHGVILGYRKSSRPTAGGQQAEGTALPSVYLHPTAAAAVLAGADAASYPRSGAAVTAIAVNPVPADAAGGHSMTGPGYVFAAGFADGTIALYRLGHPMPIAHWEGGCLQTGGTSVPGKPQTGPQVDESSSILSIRWLTARPSVLTAVDQAGHVGMWDLSLGTTTPLHTVRAAGLNAGTAPVVAACCPAGHARGVHEDTWDVPVCVALSNGCMSLVGLSLGLASAYGGGNDTGRTVGSPSAQARSVKGQGLMDHLLPPRALTTAGSKNGVPSEVDLWQAAVMSLPMGVAPT